MTYWLGAEPTHCEISGARIEAVFYDAKMPSESWWAIMVPATFKVRGCRTGAGHGQRYEKQEDGRWLKTAG